MKHAEMDGDEMDGGAWALFRALALASAAHRVEASGFAGHALVEMGAA